MICIFTRDTSSPS